ncbi:hypothetical protein RUM44_003643 [Polyplax serrata]|uniref:Translation factor GUF1 homolog, mitochondrial n=1 Tax=Polyplax serrata TaxID=468196 RepID=A0ABR1AH14_POLSC
MLRHVAKHIIPIVKRRYPVVNFNQLRFLTRGEFHYSKEAQEAFPLERIRNFCIIAHVDHGKSTLADRLLELTGSIAESNENKQVLDRLPVEKQRGITVKAVTASLKYTYDNNDYLLNLIDTPGHVDFSNEVSRSLYACQGVILLVDANQGVQAQTIANFYSAFMLELTIIPVLNKIDLPKAQPEVVAKELETLFGFDSSSIRKISAKTGQGVEDLLRTIIEEVPPPKVSRDPPFKALLIDSWFDKFRGAILFIYVASGQVKPGDEIKSFKNNKTYLVKSTGLLKPEEEPVNMLAAGQVGVIGCNMRTAKMAFVGDTLYASNATVEPLQSFDASKPMVFAGLFPRDQSEYQDLSSALEKLTLNDPSVTVTEESSPALGLGWRLGFLGLLHLDVFRQRLEQEYDADTVLTAPSVPYRVKYKETKKEKGREVEIRNPTHYPDDPHTVEETYEPMVLATIITPVKHYAEVVEECMSRRGREENATPLDSDRIMLKFHIPLSEIMFDFHDKLKSLSSGYASFDYEDSGYERAPLRKIKILLNGKEVEELTVLAHVDRAEETARTLVRKLEELIPRQQVQIAIQAAVGGTIIARRTLKAYRKDVTAKLYGGDVTRRQKLLAYQREGKKRMRMFTNIQIEKDTFIEVLRKN